MKTIKLPRQTMLEILYGENDSSTVISDEVASTSRWSIHYELIFSYDDKFYRTNYCRGATEYQDEQPWQQDLYEKEVTCVEVKPVTKTVIVYEDVDD